MNCFRYLIKNWLVFLQRTFVTYIHGMVFNGKFTNNITRVSDEQVTNPIFENANKYKWRLMKYEIMQGNNNMSLLSSPPGL